MENIQSIIQIIQVVVIILATMFTTWWAYKTFAHKEKINELKRIIGDIEELYFELYFIQKIEKELDNGRSLSKFLDILLQLKKHSSEIVYLKKSEKKRIMDGVKELINLAHEIVLEHSDKKWKNSEKEFHKKYTELKEKVYKIGQKYV